jgi:hypothetical protein
MACLWLGRCFHSCLLFRLRIGLVPGNVLTVTLAGTRWPATLQAKDGIPQPAAAFLAMRVAPHGPSSLFAAP